MMNPYEDDRSEPEDESRWPCACGDPTCFGVYEDPGNYRLGKAWYAAECKHKPLAITEDQDRAFRADVARDDDSFNLTRR